MPSSCLMRRMKRARSSRSSRLRPAEGSSSSSSARLERQRAREADDLLDAERQAADRRVAIALQLDEIDDASRPPRDGESPRAARSAGTASRRSGCVRMRAWRPVSRFSSTRHLREQLAVLERARNAERARSRAAAGRRCPRPRKRIAPCAAIDAADAVEHAGLAGAVRADQREQLARLDRERHVVEHGEAAEAQRRDRRPRAQPYHLRLRRYCLTSR